MNRADNPFRSILADIQGPSPYSADEITQLRLQAWRQQGLLIASPADRRLCEADRAAIIRIGEQLYGQEYE